jgi:hypothetical protein
VYGGSYLKAGDGIVAKREAKASFFVTGRRREQKTAATALPMRRYTCSLIGFHILIKFIFSEKCAASLTLGMRETADEIAEMFRSQGL